MKHPMSILQQAELMYQMGDFETSLVVCYNNNTNNNNGTL